MSNIIITINTDNDAFYDDEHNEVAGILKHLAEVYAICRVSELDGMRLRDHNGNSVGTVTASQAECRGFS